MAKSTAGWALTLVALGSLQASAIEIEEGKLSLNGFASWAYGASDDNDFNLARHTGNFEAWWSRSISARAPRCARSSLATSIARARPRCARRCLGAGMDGYLPKPIRPAALFAAIEAAVSQSPSPPPVEAAANEMVLDEASLLALVGGDSALIRELTALFLQDSPARMAEMASALDAGDRTALERAAHTLKGSAGSLCGHPAARAALYLEDLAKSGDLGEARRAHAALGDEVRKLQDALADLARRHAA